eukprot:CAMPEP_0171513192 /NCGR_PEP_ID=MMETSP0959-20130129/2074_1 /TAXON_ID=87120 /ORGANISM="Aurantiochytrium limacinum, Strain ATCCMYA-1381" /LENGTH=163 /DNA_ID=CAMNT_0012051223 /DNA_START=13 /DNA_END=504 /DNA_ORIENTATION=+
MENHTGSNSNEYNPAQAATRAIQSRLGPLQAELDSVNQKQLAILRDASNCRADLSLIQDSEAHKQLRDALELIPQYRERLELLSVRMQAVSKMSKQLRVRAEAAAQKKREDLARDHERLRQEALLDAQTRVDVEHGSTKNTVTPIRVAQKKTADRRRRVADVL